ncbi:PTS mannitol transporter subunit IICB [Oceanobacillus jeddahense]|uniref:PTS system mannitol-specific EIICB component n=1 Tax=Oceanobacillus jeddahense TaxID=1462527 RepID=A0ABY5JRS7_9BACI|nr:PTS mannitol transporter subunit IICB [Oceanobacillus jeddahense]UUI03003.1 PTS mannitol transporter subunit IICB [Oceanobacillus jeddahense]
MAQGKAVKNSKILEKIRKFGGYLSNMVMPNLGAFVGWGILAALFIPNGWFPNENLSQMVEPILIYLLPLLVGYTAGYNIHGQRGGVIGALSTMGVIVGADVTMFIGAMIIAPLAAWILKKVDGLFAGKIKPGFEMLVDNFSLGLIGAGIALFGFISVGPAMGGLLSVMASGINWIVEQNVFPLLSIFMAPAQVLFLNNAVNHGILAPLGFQEAAELGKSLMFLVDTNNGPLLGTLLAIAVFGKGKAKKMAPMAMLIAGIGGIGEVYFPFVLANPILLFATMGGLGVSLFILEILGGGLVGVASPGSLIMIGLMTPPDAVVANIVGIGIGFLVAFAIGAGLLKTFGSPKEDMTEEVTVKKKSKKGSNDVQSVDSIGADAYAQSNSPIRKIIVACDSGMGSSAMGAAVLRKRVIKEGFKDIEVVNSSLNKLTSDADIIVTLESLLERAKLSVDNANIDFLTVNNFLKDTEYDDVMDVIYARKNDKVSSE